MINKPTDYFTKITIIFIKMSTILTISLAITDHAIKIMIKLQFGLNSTI